MHDRAIAGGASNAGTPNIVTVSLLNGLLVVWTVLWLFRFLDDPFKVEIHAPRFQNGTRTLRLNFVHCALQFYQSPDQKRRLRSIRYLGFVIRIAFYVMIVAVTFTGLIIGSVPILLFMLVVSSCCPTIARDTI